jgi:putative ABC transport system permease protein
MRLHRWIVAVASRFVPKASRREWRDEWDAELQHHEAVGRQWRGETLGRRLDLLRRSSGALWDALWLQSHRWYSLRLFGRHWRLAAAAVLSLAVAIAATTIGLSAYNTLMLRPPNVGSPRTLRFIHVRTPSNAFDAASFPEFTTYRTHTRAFEDIAAFPYAISTLSLRAGDRTQQILATQVSDNYFGVLGVAPRAGLLTLRTSPARDVFDAVISEKLWRTLGADPHIAGTTIRLNEQPVTVAGVAAGGFGGMTWGFEPDVWMSFHTAENVFGSPPAELTDRSQRRLHMVGRLRPGVGTAEAAADVASIATGIAQEFPAVSRDHTASLTALTITPPGDRAWMGMVLGCLLLIVLLTLVVAGTNVVNLLLGLATSRRHEMLVRAALGASRIQIVVPMVREAVVLVLASAVLGYAAGWAILTKVAAFTPSLGPNLPSPSFDLRPDAAVLLATAIVAIAAGVAIGLPPALRAASDGLSGAITRATATGDPRRSRVRQALIAVQMAVATVVLAGVGASLHSLFNLRHLPLGFTARHLVYGGVDVQRSGYDRNRMPAFFERMRERVASVGGVEAVTLASDPPLMGYSVEAMTVDGAPSGAAGADMAYLLVDERYFSTLGIALQRGRTFDSRDRAGRTEVAVVNQTFARRYFPDTGSIGRRLRRASDGHVLEIVGVVANGIYNEIDEGPLPLVYLPLAQHDAPMVTVIARSAGPSDTVVRALLEMDPRIVIGGVGALTLEDALRVSLAVPLTMVWATLVFGTIAIGMSVFGLYSTVFYSVGQRRMEIGIRTALGASTGDLFGLVLRQTGWLAAAGALAGLASGFALMPLAASIFYGVAPIEPLAMAGAAAGVAALVLLTTYRVVKPWTRLAAMELLRR